METKVLYSTLFGSHLYGTNTPTSDLDYKRVVLPSLDDLLLCKRIENKVEKTNTAKNTRNTVDDVDREDIPLQVFIRDFAAGQTYALEIAFSIDGTHAGQQIFPVLANGNEWNEHRCPQPPNYMFSQLVHTLRTQFLTSNVKAMMGYVFNQANIYSFKGERLNCAREFQMLVAEADLYYKDDKATMDILQAPAWKKHVDRLVAKYPNYFRVTEYDIGEGRMKPCFIVLEKTFPWTNTIVHSLGVIETIINKYGSRANQASEANVDWKAMMHAVRIIDQGLELLETKRLTLPRPPEQVARLLMIKRGEHPLEPLKQELVEKLDRLSGLTKQTDLPLSTDPVYRANLEAFTLGWLRRFYAL